MSLSLGNSPEALPGKSPARAAGTHPRSAHPAVVPVQGFDPGIGRMGIAEHRALPWLEELTAGGGAEMDGTFMTFTESDYGPEQLRRFRTFADQARERTLPLGRRLRRPLLPRGRFPGRGPARRPGGPSERGGGAGRDLVLRRLHAPGGSPADRDAGGLRRPDSRRSPVNLLWRTRGAPPPPGVERLHDFFGEETLVQAVLDDLDGEAQDRPDWYRRFRP